jgi:AraC family transcriptional regulator
MELCTNQLPSNPEPRLDRRRLVEILLEASDALDTDTQKAKRYLQYAASLLRGNRSSWECTPRLRKGLRSWQVKQIRVFVESQLDTRIRVSDLAEQCHLSTGHLNRGFKQVFGQTPQVYIRERRILRAKALMLSSNESLASIAIGCGLCDQAHLSRVFLRIVGETPHVWRRRARSSDHFDGSLHLQTASDNDSLT